MNSAIFSLIIGFVTVTTAGKGFSQNTNAPPYIKVDLDIQGNSLSRRGLDTNWITHVRSWSASVVLGSNQWSIESGFAANATGFWFCDGTNVFRSVDIHYHPTNADLGIAIAPIIGRTPNVGVVPGTHPMGDFEVNLLWLAYCSGNYLQSTNRLLPLPGGEPRHQIELFAVEDKSVLSDLSPFLPSKIEFLAKRGNAAKAAQSQFIFRSEKPIFVPGLEAVLEADGTLLAAYQVEQFTNYSGWTIPVMFTYFQTNRPVGFQGSGMRYFITGKVTRISEATAPRSPLEEARPHLLKTPVFDTPTDLLIRCGIGGLIMCYHRRMTPPF